MAGVRQGCPASATFFAWSSHPLLVYIEKNLAPGRCIKGYADDVFLILHNIWNELGHLFITLGVIANATNLRVNVKKTIIVPLWACAVARVRAMIGRRFPHLSHLEVAETAKYLGFWVGPGAGDTTWIAPLRKFLGRAADCRNLGGGTCVAINAINTYAYSVLGFTCQLRDPTAEVIRTCKHFNRKVMGGPYRWLPDELIPTAKIYLGAKAQPFDIEVLALTTKLRVICGNTLDWQQECTEIRQANQVRADRDGRTLLELTENDEWRCRLSCFVLQRAAVEGEKLGIIQFRNNKWERCGMDSPINGNKT